MTDNILIPKRAPVNGVWVKDNFFFRPSFAYKSLHLDACSLYEDHITVKGPVNLEICSGNGSWLCDKAELDMSSTWIGVEKKLGRAISIWKRASNLSNVVIACCDGYLFLRYNLPSESVDACYVNFPDPWPKYRHAKNRLFSTHMVFELKRVLKKGSFLMLVTDSEEMALESKRSLACFKESTISEQEKQNYGKSYFHNLFDSKCLKIHFLKFVN